jgi:two-component system, LytTR family, response regulator
MPIRTLLIDDEPIARKGIRILLKSAPDIQVVGECGDGIEAVEMISGLHPDLIFLDIQMPELDGFGVLEALDKHDVPVVIFVTAYDEYAMKAINAHALDYLLKPVKQEQFRIALNRARAMLQFGKTAEFDKKLTEIMKYVSASRKYLERLVIKSAQSVVIVQAHDVDWIEAYGDYVKIHTREKKYLLRQKISTLEESLDPERFLRIHRSAIVQIDRIQEMRPLTNGDYTIFLKDGTRLPLSRSYREKIFRHIQPKES